MAEAVKNLAGPTVGEQVTALKRVSPEIGDWVNGLVTLRDLLQQQALLEAAVEIEPVDGTDGEEE